MIGSKECFSIQEKERRKRWALYSAYILRNQTDDTR